MSTRTQVSEVFFSLCFHSILILNFGLYWLSAFKVEAGQYTDEMQMGELWSINTSLTPIKRKKTVWPRPAARMTTTAAAGTFKTSQDY